jgi:hypothetical protein
VTVRSPEDGGSGCLVDIVVDVVVGFVACASLALIAFGVSHAPWFVVAAGMPLIGFAAYGAYRLFRAVRNDEDYGGPLEVAAILTAIAVPLLAVYMVVSCGCLW